MNHLQMGNPYSGSDARRARAGAFDALSREEEFPRRSKLTGNVMRKGKGAEPWSRCRCRGIASVGRKTVMTRLTRTMGFVEESCSPSVAGSIGTFGDDDADLTDPAWTAAH